jgi:hypothetical protein
MNIKTSEIRVPTLYISCFPLSSTLLSLHIRVRLKLSLCSTKHHAFGESGFIVPRILDLGTGWK